MSRAAIVVSAWIAVTCGIAERLLRVDPGARLQLLLLQLAVSVATALALWLELAEDPPPPLRRGDPRLRTPRA